MSSETKPHGTIRGLLLVVSSPSGAGKTTLCNKLREEFDRLEFSVSHTTRPPRPGETDGVEYHFTGKPEFQEMIAREQFAEHAMVHGNMYGTSASRVREAIDSGHDLLFDVDYQGGRQLREKFRDDLVSVFILPPSIRELERRLRSRNTDSDEVIARRLRVAREELKRYPEYDFLIMNDDLENAYEALRSVYVAHLHARTRQSALADAVISGQESLL